MAIVKRKKKDPELKLSKYPQYIIDLNKPDQALKFYKEARYAGYDDAYITKALVENFNYTNINQIFKNSDGYIKDYKKEMWADFYKCNPQFKP